MNLTSESRFSNFNIIWRICSVVIALSAFILVNSAYSQSIGTLTDSRDGKNYKTVTVAGKVWMAKNMSYDAGAGSSCFNDNPANCEKYGRLYTQESAIKACPSGWRLPSKTELEMLVKKSGSALQSFENLVDGGASGFNALFGGWREKSGRYGYLDDSANFWSATKTAQGKSWYLDISKSGRGAGIFVNINEGSAFSVRCLKN